MSILEMINIWKAGCSCAEVGQPFQCQECTLELIKSIETHVTKGAQTQTAPKTFTVSSIINRLQGIYPIGPIGENGEPEFGWESRSGTMSDVHIPTPLMLEASHVINTMNDEIAQRDEELEDMRLSWIPEEVVRELCVSVNAFRDVCEAMASGHKVDYEQVKADINTAVYKIFPLCEVLTPE